MQRKNIFLRNTFLTTLLACLMLTHAQAAKPLWTIEPLSETTIEVPANGTATIKYKVTNQSSKPHTLTMQPIQGLTQITAGTGVCGYPAVLRGKSACTLVLQVDGSQLKRPIADGPVVCQGGSKIQCYRPSQINILRINQAPPITDAKVKVSGSPLVLTPNGPTGQLAITNTSTEVAATNIAPDFSGTALDGHVTATSDCDNVPAGGSCTMTFTPDTTVVPETNFTIQGSNTNALTPAISIQSGSALTSINPTSGTASGGTGFTLTGTGLTGATGITFGETPATSVHVVNSTTVTGVTPAHAVGVVDIMIDTPAGGATLANGYTYEATAVGQVTGGGVIACLNNEVLNNLIAATADNGINIEWGGFNTEVGPGAQSDTDGAANTAAIVSCLTNGEGCAGSAPDPLLDIDTYAAGICSTYEVDSQGKSPCEPGNTCYDDWFLPAGNNSTATGQLNCLYDNRGSIHGFADDYYWSSTEFSGLPTDVAWLQVFSNGGQGGDDKFDDLRVRCVRAFNP